MVAQHTPQLPERPEDLNLGILIDRELDRAQVPAHLRASVRGKTIEIVLALDLNPLDHDWKKVRLEEEEKLRIIREQLSVPLQGHDEVVESQRLISSTVDHMLREARRDEEKS